MLGHHIIMPSGRRIPAKVTYRRRRREPRIECAHGITAHPLRTFDGRLGWPGGWRRLSAPPNPHGAAVRGLLCQLGHPFGKVVEVHFPFWMKP